MDGNDEDSADKCTTRRRPRHFLLPSWTCLVSYSNQWNELPTAITEGRSEPGFVRLDSALYLMGIVAPQF